MRRYEPWRRRNQPAAGRWPRRVLELAGIGPGPFCAMLLADQGATVLNIHRPGAALPRPAHPEREFLNRGRRSAVLDLKHPRAVDALLRLADTADVLLEGLRPGVTERLGVGPEVCLSRNPRLVYARMTGWGQDGPLASTVGHDIGYIAGACGALHALGRADGPPQFPANLLGDFGGGGMLMAYGICAALVERATSGQGQVVDAAIVDGVASLLAMPLMFMAQGVWQDERGVNLLDGGVPWYDVYETADGNWMAVGALEPRFYAALLAGLRPERGTRPPRPGELVAAARAVHDPVVQGQDQGRVGGGLRRQRGRRRAGAVDARGGQGPAPDRAGDLRGPGRRGPAAPAPRFSRHRVSCPGLASVPGLHTTEALTDWGLPDTAELIACGAAVQTLSVRDQGPVGLEVGVVVERHQARSRVPADDLGDAGVDQQPGQAGPALLGQPERLGAEGGDDPAGGHRDGPARLGDQMSDRGQDAVDERGVAFGVARLPGDPAADSPLPAWTAARARPRPPRSPWRR